MDFKMNLRTWLVKISFLLVIGCTSFANQTIYVDIDANGLNDGSSWENAYTFLQDALTYVKSMDEQFEIRVAQGIYKPNQGLLPIIPPGAGGRGGEISMGVWPGDRGNNISFELLNGVTIKGGYAGIGEPDPNIRDIEAYKTILSGDLNGDDIDVDDPCDLLNERTRFDNSHHVVVGGDINETAVLDGFVITSGYFMAVSMGPPTGGAGMLISSGSPTLIDCTFTYNTVFQVGGGLYNLSSSPTLINCTFTRNYAGSGAGMCNFPAWQSPQGSNPTLIDCTFDNNYASLTGGGMYNLSSNPTLTNCTFSRNLTPGLGAGIYNDKSNLVLTNCEFNENAGGSGGGIYSEDNSSLKLVNCTFWANLATWAGGGMCSEDTNDLILINCIFSANSAKQMGGGMLNTNNTTLNNCLFAGNKTYGEPWPNQGEAGGLYAFGDATLTNCTFYGNWAQEGRAILKYSFSNLRLINCILWNGGDEISNGDSLRTKLTYSNVQGDWPGEGNINEDPLFANPGYWASADDPNQIAEPNDPNSIWIDGDYHLKSQASRWDPKIQSWVIDDVTSPSIDAGDPNNPVGLEPFPNGGRINMGAYGGTAEASKSYFGEPLCQTIIAGDINGDCKVDFQDFAIMVSRWSEHNY
ncbi:MAG: hypothetical protein PVJ60_07160 [Phycisphaerales bacterium]|jgi:hypothetical protein